MDIDPLTPEDMQTREMYARYGLAMYFAQSLEAGIKTTLVLAQLDAREFATLSDFDASWASNFNVTMGKLIHRFAPHISDDPALSGDLQLALKLRNQLAHHFFWNHAADANTPHGRQRMIDECMAAVGFFQDVDQRLHAMTERLSQAQGTSPDMLSSRTTEVFAELLSTVPDYGSRNCPRCLVPMDMAGSEDRPYWLCSACGSITLA